MNLGFLKSSQSEIILSIRFLVLFGISVLGFQKVSGISQTHDVDWINEGGVNTHPVMLHSPQKNAHQLQFSRGIQVNTLSISNMMVSSGVKTTNYGQMGKSPNIGTVIVLNQDKNVKAIYGFVSRGVMEWQVSDLDAQNGNAPLIETFTVAHDGLYNIPIPDFL